MDQDALRMRMLQAYGIRIEPEMARYVLKRLQGAGEIPLLPVIGGNARTGLPVRIAVDPAKLSGQALGTEIDPMRR